MRGSETSIAYLTSNVTVNIVREAEYENAPIFPPIFFIRQQGLFKMNTRKRKTSIRQFNNTKQYNY